MSIERIFTTKSNINKPLLKLLHINIKEYTKYTIFMPAHCVYSIKNAIYLTFFPSPFTNRASLFFFVNITFCFSQRFFFRFFVFAGCFGFSVRISVSVWFSLRKRCPYSELFWSVYSRIRTEYGKIQSRISPYSVRMRENTDQSSSEYGHFSRSVFCPDYHA